MVDLVPGSNYTFEVYGTSVCGRTLSAYIHVGTDMKGRFYRHYTLLYLPSDFRVVYVANISKHLTIAWEIDHHNGNYVPHSFRQVRGFFNVPC